MGRKPRRLDRAALARLAQHRWPGNVRELRNLLERVVILTPGETITEADVAAHLPMSAAALPVAPVAAPVPSPDPADEDDEPAVDAPAGSLKAQLEAAERVAIEEALKRAGTVARAAEELGLERSHLYKKLRKHRLPY
jgi:sigma-54 specific flagellar transcriptional regulator A